MVTLPSPILLYYNIIFGFSDIHKCFVSNFGSLIYDVTNKTAHRLSSIRLYLVVQMACFVNCCFLNMVISDIKDNICDGQLGISGKLYLTNQITNKGHFKCLVKIRYMLLESRKDHSKLNLHDKSNVIF